MSAYVDVVINPDGTFTLDVHGIKGKACTEFTKPLEEALGEVTERTPKKEMHEKPMVVQQPRRLRA